MVDLHSVCSALEKTMRHSDTVNTEWSRTEKPLGGQQAILSLVLFPQSLCSGCSAPWVTQSLCRCYFLCINTNTTAIQKNQRETEERGSDSEKDKESVVEETEEFVAGHQGFPAVFSHWPNLVSFFPPSVLKSISQVMWSQWSLQPSQQ